MNFVLIREPVTKVVGGENFTRGKLYLSGLYLCETLEDEDRKLECGGEKCFGITAIPRGVYTLIATLSNRFKKVLPLLKDVPEFSGVRIHGGNKAENSEGCILVGKVRTATGIAACADTVQYITQAIIAASNRGEEVTLEIK